MSNNIVHVANTRSGKLIYDMPWHESYESFDINDHEDAARYHFNQWETLYEQLVIKYGTTYKAKRKYKNNKRLIKWENNWRVHEQKKLLLKVKQLLEEKKQKRLDNSKIVLSEYELQKKKEISDSLKEFREKKKNLSEEDKFKVQCLENKLNKLKWMHPDDCYEFSVSVREQRQKIRSTIKSIINSSKS